MVKGSENVEEKESMNILSLCRNENLEQQRRKVGSDEGNLGYKEKEVSSEIPPKLGSMGGNPAPSKEDSLRSEFSDMVNRGPIGWKQVKILFHLGH